MCVAMILREPSRDKAEFDRTSHRRTQVRRIVTIEADRVQTELDKLEATDFLVLESETTLLNSSLNNLDETLRAMLATPADQAAQQVVDEWENRIQQYVDRISLITTRVRRRTESESAKSLMNRAVRRHTF